MRYWVGNKEITEEEMKQVIENNNKLIEDDDCSKWQEVELVVITDDFGKIIETKQYELPK